MMYFVVVGGTVILATGSHAEAVALANSQDAVNDGATVYQVDGHPVHTVPPAPAPSTQG